jgi:fructose-6-phosphate aldolase 2
MEQAHKCCMADAHAVTVSTDIMNKMLCHPFTDWSVEQFVKDWEGLYGEG